MALLLGDAPAVVLGIPSSWRGAELDRAGRPVLGPDQRPLEREPGAAAATQTAAIRQAEAGVQCWPGSVAAGADSDGLEGAPRAVAVQTMVRAPRRGGRGGAGLPG